MDTVWQRQYRPHLARWTNRTTARAQQQTTPTKTTSHQEETRNIRRAMCGKIRPKPRKKTRRISSSLWHGLVCQNNHCLPNRTEDNPQPTSQLSLVMHWTARLLALPCVWAGHTSSLALALSARARSRGVNPSCVLVKKS